jgi:hypothetical protein
VGADFHSEARWADDGAGPDGANVTAPLPCRHSNNAMVKAIARAFRWREMLENGTHATIAEIAADEKINESYVSRLSADAASA